MNQSSRKCICGDCLQSEIVDRVKCDISQMQQCIICGANKLTLNVSKSEIFRKVSITLLKYHFDGLEYSGHQYENIGKLFVSNKVLFGRQAHDKIEICQELLEEILSYDENGDPTNFKILSHEKAIKNDLELHESLSEIPYGLKVLKSDIEKLFTTANQKIKAQKCQVALYRARLGYKTEERYVSESWPSYKVRIPYGNAELSAPPNKDAKNGRFNRHGISVFYGAEDEYTAVSELRPSPGDVISIGKYLPCKELEFYNLFDVNELDFIDDEVGLRVLSNLRNILCQPKGSFNDQYYVSPQIFAEFVIDNGYDGICFPSSFTGKKNYVIFNPTQVAMEKGSNRLIEIKKVNVEFQNYQHLTTV